MVMMRRSFLKSLAALAGVGAVPALGMVLPNVPEPVKWFVESFQYESELGVGAQWGSGVSMIRHAVLMPYPKDSERDEKIAYCKQALRQWYYERHVLRKAA